MPPKKKIHVEAANVQLISQDVQLISSCKKREPQCSVFELENQINQTCENLKAAGQELKKDLLQLEAQSLTYSANLIQFQNQWKQMRASIQIEETEQVVKNYQDIKKKIKSVAEEIQNKKEQIWKLRSSLNCTFRINDCAVCFQKINPLGQLVSKYKCGHCFHQKCISKWQKEDTCPSCNTTQDNQTNYLLVGWKCKRTIRLASEFRRR